MTKPFSIMHYDALRGHIVQGYKPIDPYKVFFIFRALNMLIKDDFTLKNPERKVIA